MLICRTYVKQNQKKAVYEMGVALFSRYCVREPRIKTRLRELLLALVKSERLEEKVDRDLIKNSTVMLTEMGKEVYHEVSTHENRGCRRMRNISFLICWILDVDRDVCMYSGVWCFF
jgi:hypothetical protein